MGADPSLSINKGIPLSEDLIKRWANYVKEGIPSGEREQLRSKWIIPENGVALKAADLNPEIKTLLPDGNTKNDLFISHIQNDIGTGLSALGASLDVLLKENKLNKQLKEKVLPGLVDCAKYICNAHFQLSMHRRHTIFPNLKSEMHKVARESKIDKMLFGESFLDRCKVAQAIKKSGAELRATKKERPFTQAASSSKQNLNFTRPFPRPRFKLQNFAKRETYNQNQRFQSGRIEKRQYYKRKPNQTYNQRR